MKKLKYITKFHYGKTHGYQVRLPEFRNGLFVGNNQYQNHNKFFARSKHKSWALCLRKAKKYRNDYLKANNAMHLLTVRTRRHHAMNNSKRNSSGVIGVTYTVDYKECGTYYAYKALYSDNGTQRTRQFALNVHGVGGSFIKACRVRFKKEGILVILDETLIPCWPDVPYRIHEAV